MVNREHIKDAYDQVKKACRNVLNSAAASDAIADLVGTSLRFLTAQCHQIELNSSVYRKDYIAFTKDDIVSRPVNCRYFVGDPQAVTDNWQALSRGSLDHSAFDWMTYTTALAPCLAMELFDRNNKKGPATYFECFVGHLIAKYLGSEPTKKATLSVGGESRRMTMDFLFETEGDAPNIHLPVKMSTRERVVQAWAHQRLLDSAFGEQHYKGIMVLFSETKLDSRSHEVVEICVPDQWLIYQELLSKMDGIYYFDLPVRYRELTETFPATIKIKPFWNLVNEIEQVVGQAPST